MVPFAGWEMPVQYTGIIEEHTRRAQPPPACSTSPTWAASRSTGPQAAALLRHVCTYDMTRLQPGQGHYAAVCNPEGGIMDDVYVYSRHAPLRGRERVARGPG